MATVLLSSAGRRVALLQCFRRAAAELGVSLRVVATDMAPEHSSAAALADAAHRVPRCDDGGFVDRLAALAEAEGVDLIVPTIDPELVPLAAAAGRFAAAGTRVHVSTPETVAVVRDKMLTAERLADAGVPVPATWRLEVLRGDGADAPWPLLLKPVAGSASRGIAVVRSPDELPETTAEPMILQELLEGEEFTVNLYVDPSGRLRSVVPHRRLAVRAGEVEKGLTTRRDDIEALAERVVAALPGARGVLCFQLIDDRRRGPVVFEVNARFGGGYPLADRAGAPYCRWLLEETLGRAPSYSRHFKEGVLMLRYDAAVFRNG